jgi:hypothetical protein
MKLGGEGDVLAGGKNRNQNAGAAVFFLNSRSK